MPYVHRLRDIGELKSTTTVRGAWDVSQNSGRLRQPRREAATCGRSGSEKSGPAISGFMPTSIEASPPGLLKALVAATVLRERPDSGAPAWPVR